MDPGETPKRQRRGSCWKKRANRAKRFSVFLTCFDAGVPGRADVYPAGGRLTAGEAQPRRREIEARAYSLKELKQMIYMGKLRDAKSVAGILYYVTFLRKER